MTPDAPPRHPDAAMIDATIDALARWLRTEPTSPTSQITGGGAIAACESLLSACHAHRPVTLVPSATFGILSALRALGVGPGDEVLIPQLDWTATLAAVRTLGATPVVVPVDEATWTIAPAAAADRATTRTRAAVAVHLLGIPADVPALASAIGTIPIVEDCSGAFGSTLDGRSVGTLGSYGVLGFGPTKTTFDVGEAAAVVAADVALHHELLRRSAHPVRQLLGGVAEVDDAALSMRVHPLAAIALRVHLGDRRPAGSGRPAAADGLALLGDDPRRRNGSPFAPALPAPTPDGAGPLRRLRTREVLDIAALVAGERRTREITLVPVVHDERAGDAA